MSYIQRFGEAYQSAAVELARSFPVCTPDAEIVFFYETEPNDTTSFRLGKICGILRREVRDGVVAELPIESALPAELLERAVGTVIAPPALGDEAVRCSAAYRESYEEFMKNPFPAKPSSADRENMRVMYESFLRLVPESPLLEMYEALAGELFRFLREQTGTSGG